MLMKWVVAVCLFGAVYSFTEQEWKTHIVQTLGRETTCLTTNEVDCVISLYTEDAKFYRPNSSVQTRAGES